MSQFLRLHIILGNSAKGLQTKYREKPIAQSTFFWFTSFHTASQRDKSIKGRLVCSAFDYQRPFCVPLIMTYFRLSTGLLVIPKLFVQMHFNELKPCKTIVYGFERVLKIWLQWHFFVMTFKVLTARGRTSKDGSCSQLFLAIVKCKNATATPSVSFFLCVCLAPVLRSVAMNMHQNNPAVTYFGIDALSACWRRDLFQEPRIVRYDVDIFVVLYKWKNVQVMRTFFSWQHTSGVRRSIR